MKPWFARFRRYPGSVLGHIAWGAMSGIVGSRDPVSGAALLSGGYAYQFGSAWRKSQLTRIDSVGLDCLSITPPAMPWATPPGARLRALAW